MTTYAEAKKLGEGCGLTKPAEFVNNIFMHVLNLFPYEKIAEEEQELRDDAAKHGVRFSKVCGDAILDGASEDELCYICIKLSALKQQGW